jgi:hypothetical protein
MADRGKLIPVSVRLEIKQRLLEEPVRKVADSLRLSKTTVQKYGNNKVTKPLNATLSVG